MEHQHPSAQPVSAHLEAGAEGRECVLPEAPGIGWRLGICQLDTLVLAFRYGDRCRVPFAVVEHGLEHPPGVSGRQRHAVT